MNAKDHSQVEDATVLEPEGTPPAEEAGETPPPAPDAAAEAVQIETITPAPAAGEPGPLEVADDAEPGPEDGDGEIFDTTLARMLSTPAGMRSAIEALLFVSPEPLTPHRIARALEINDSHIVSTLITQLRGEYEEQKRGLQIIETAEGYQMATREVFGDLVLRLKNRKRRPTLSPAALETLAIIAYRQPIIRAEVEAVRGVESSGTIRNLIDMGLVEMVGRKEVLGRPPMYGTSEQFLQSFGLRHLADLPSIGELKRRFAENEAKAAEAAAAPAADAAPAEQLPPGDLPGQMFIEVPEDPPAPAAQAAPETPPEPGEEEPLEIPERSPEEFPQPAADPEQDAADQSTTGGEAATEPGPEQESAEEPTAPGEIEEPTMSIKKHWNEEDKEREDDFEDQDIEDLEDDEDEEDDEEDEDDEDDFEDLEDDEDADEDEEDEEEDEDEEDEEDEDEEDFEDQDIQDLEDEEEDEDEDEGGKPKRRR